MQYSRSQYERASEIVGNISVAWFTAGVISPIFLNPIDYNYLKYFALANVLTAVSFIISLELADQKKAND